jgi:hypothetical protein
MVVARFLDAVHHDANQNGLANRNGLLEWCAKIDRETMAFPTYVKKLAFYNVEHLAEKVPCFSEFVRLTMWYNNLNKMLQGMDYMTVRFEDLTKKLEETVEKIIDFTGVVPVIDPSEAMFHRTFKKYQYFLDEEIRYIREVIKGVAVDRTWYMLDHYFSFFANE